ncbi:hypothetical protein HDU90_005760 [Geranomyces variabilis]|nr:hypothetical protein HDU90_005760 [Geranomyces variabilis]
MTAFSLESARPFPLPAGPTTISTYKHASSNFRIIFCPVPGPLCSSSIIVPTLAQGDEGLAHTLEHLIFCGSTINGYRRGYLDYLANRCLSTGTNAYTTEDHTAYTITTAGSEGMTNLIPVFLEHVLFPTLREEQFVTEVHHLDGDAKHQGVVFCEMAGRENTEADLLDLAMRRLLYANQTTYSHECGGLTPQVAALTNAEIVQYHERFYHLDNLTIIMCGQVDPQNVFDKLSAVKGLLEPRRNKQAAPIPVIEVPKLTGKPGHVHKKTVRFPSSEEDIGSIAFGWRGPPSEDIFSIVALDVLFRFLQETSASPFLQKFVERADPYSSQVDYDVRGYVETAIEIVFSGVPYFSGSTDANPDAMDTDLSEDDSDEGFEESEGESEDGSESESEGNAREDLFEPGVFQGMVMEVLQDFAENPKPMQSALSRHRRKIMEALEEDPLESCSSYIIPDVVRHYVGSTARKEGGQPVFGTRAEMLSILDQLADRSLDFWSNLAKKWLIDVPMVEVHMVPDHVLAADLVKKEDEERDARVAAIGEAGLAKLRQILEEAVEANKVDLTDEAIAGMPPVPDVTKAPRLNTEMEFVPLEPANDAVPRPFAKCQVVKTETVFSNVRIGLHTAGIPDNLRPYLVLFQELLFQTPLTLHSPNGEVQVVDYREVAQRCADLFVSYEAAAGFGNDLWSAGWLSEVFMISASSESDTWTTQTRFLIQVLLFSTFTEERIITSAKNLLSGISELKRDGPDMLSSVSTRITSPFDRPHTATAGQKNDLAISVFRQEDFIKGLLAECKQGASHDVIEALEQIKASLLQKIQADCPGFVQIAVPSGESKALVREFLHIWDEEFSAYKAHAQAGKPTTGLQSKDLQISPFPFPRHAYTSLSADRTFGDAVLVPIPGVTTTFFSQIVPCDVLSPHPHPDFFSVTLLAELLSRTEGPLYTAIRGRGFAYGASVSLSYWPGQLTFDLYESSEPRKALNEFYDILHDLSVPEKFEEICSVFNVETARASAAYNYANAKSTSGAMIGSALRGALRGFQSLDEEERFHQGLYNVTPEMLQGAYQKYFARFLEADSRITVATTSPGGVDSLLEQFLTTPKDCANPEPYKIKLRSVSLAELKV